MKCTRLPATVVVSLTLALVSSTAAAQVFSLGPGPAAPIGAAAYLAGPPCFLAAPFAPAGDLLTLGPPTSVIPFGGAPGCGLGHIIPGNVDAFSSGLGPAAGLPIPPFAAGFAFSVDFLATGDAGAFCAAPPPLVAGPFPPDVTSEAGNLGIGGTTDAAADIFGTLTGPIAPLPAGVPFPGSMLHTQVMDGDGLAAPPFFFAPILPGAGLLEPLPPGDELDATDGAPIGAIDPIGPDGVPDVNVYYSVDVPTAAALFASPGDIFTSVGGVPGIYVPSLVLGLVPGDDIDALYVTDFDGFPAAYLPGVDVALFSLAPGSPSIGIPDCSGGIPIGEGTILTDGAACAPFFVGCFAGSPPCTIADAGDMNLWSAAICGPNPLTGAGDDNIDAFDLAGAPFPPPPTPVPTIPPPTLTPTATPTPTPTVTPTATSTVGGPTATCTAVPPPAGPTPTPGNTKAGKKCQRTIAKEVSKFVKAKMKALDKCHNSILKDKLADPGPGGGARLAACFLDVKTGDKIAKASSKIMAKIASKCGGSNKVCGDFDANEETPGDLGFDATCPSFEGSCAAVITDCSDLSTCVECIAEAAIDQSMVLYYDAMIDSAVGSTLNKCQQKIGKETTKYFLAKEKLLLKCKDARLNGKHTDACPDVTAPAGSVAEKTAVKIAKAESKKITKICKACGGASKTCDTTVTLINPGGPASIPGVANADDLSPVAIGFPASCTNVTTPPVPSRPATACSGTVSTLADLVTCVDCVTEFKADCVDASARPQFDVYPCECK